MRGAAFHRNHGNGRFKSELSELPAATPGVRPGAGGSVEKPGAPSPWAGGP